MEFVENVTAAVMYPDSNVTYGDDDVISSTEPTEELLPMQGPPGGVPTLVNVGILLKKYTIPPVVVVGMVGNLLTLLAMSRPALKKSSSSVYFRFLAVLDTLHLLHYLLTGWYDLAIGDNLYMHFDITCKLRVALSMYVTCAPAWMVVSLTAERAIVTTFPLQGKRWCTPRAAVITSLIITVGVAVLWLGLIYMDGAKAGGCDKRAYREFMLEIGFPLSMALYTFVPTPLLIFFNGVLIYQVAKAARARKGMTSQASQGADPAMARVTKMAVTVSLTYFILTLPTMVFAYLDRMVNGFRAISQQPEIKLLHDICIILREVNHAVNFFIYAMMMPKVRAELAALLPSCCTPKQPLPVRPVHDPENATPQISTKTTGPSPS